MGIRRIWRAELDKAFPDGVEAREPKRAERDRKIEEARAQNAAYQAERDAKKADKAAYNAPPPVGVDGVLWSSHLHGAGGQPNGWVAVYEDRIRMRRPKDNPRTVNLADVVTVESTPIVAEAVLRLREGKPIELSFDAKGLRTMFVDVVRQLILKRAAG